ncbi:MAG TPA: DUF4215 domain-containing protein [Candidatus Polarisedimenticolia bacterium]|nr:DUF4215 domain-containing protein [Candidatus Polarisedimenticolia bacterium]
MRRTISRLVSTAAVAVALCLVSGGSPSAEPACAYCPADACPAGGFEDIIDQICDLAPLDVCKTRCGCCRDEVAEPFAGVTFGPPAPGPIVWPGLGGRGRIAGETELCLLRDLGMKPGGITFGPNDISVGPLGKVSLTPRVGYVDFDAVGRTMRGFHAVSVCVPPLGCIDDQVQPFTAHLVSSPAQADENCGSYPFVDTYGLQVLSPDTEHRLDVDLEAISVMTPYGVISATPEFHYDTSLKSGFPGDVTTISEFGTCVSFHAQLASLPDRFQGANGIEFACLALPAPHFQPGLGGVGQVALGSRSADPSVAIYTTGTPRPDLDLSIARTIEEKRPVGHVGAAVEFKYSILGLLPAKFQGNPFEPVAEVFVKPGIDTSFASQFQVHGVDGAWQLENALPADCGDSEYHRAAVDLRAHAENFTSFQILSGFNLVISLVHDFGGFIGTIKVKVIDEHESFDVIPPIDDTTSADGPVAGAVFSPDAAPAFASLKSFTAPTGVADPQGFLQECFTTTPPAPGTPPTPTFTPDDPRKFTKVLEFPCNLCLQWGGKGVCGPKDASKGLNYECTFENGECRDLHPGADFCVIHPAPPELLPAGSEVLFGAAQPAGKEWLCDAPEKTGCMDLCTYDPTAAQPLKVVRSASDLDPDRCGGAAGNGVPCSTAAQCDDGNPCTHDVCGGTGEFTTCTHTAQEGACNDGLYCNGADHCALGACSIHDGNPCAAQAACCSESVDACVGEDACPKTDPRCGNGFVQPGEACDDGNLANGDGCSAACLLECGNHVIDPGETCDDGNTQDGDGCSAICRLEKQPPDCGGAFATTSEIWPPNHRMVGIGIGGVTDDTGAPVGITITGIRQDEPLDGLGDGNTCADADGIGTGSARVRAERTGTPKVPGDGRVYHVAFTADDGQGGQCQGVVTVCVPHDQRPGHLCVDQGALYDSTSPCASH